LNLQSFILVSIFVCANATVLVVPFVSKRITLFFRALSMGVIVIQFPEYLAGSSRMILYAAARKPIETDFFDVF
jgi:hypothetical protein